VPPSPPPAVPQPPTPTIRALMLFALTLFRSDTVRSDTVYPRQPFAVGNAGTDVGRRPTPSAGTPAHLTAIRLVPRAGSPNCCRCSAPGSPSQAQGSASHAYLSALAVAACGPPEAAARRAAP